MKNKKNVYIKLCFNNSKKAYVNVKLNKNRRQIKNKIKTKMKKIQKQNKNFASLELPLYTSINAPMFWRES